jgi:serine/threonine protein kinase
LRNKMMSSIRAGSARMVIWQRVSHPFLTTSSWFVNMSLSAGSRIGVYEITAPIGAGGMGVVYRARDTRLARNVAVKVLPDSFAADPERLMRFEREAKHLAALNHPHIAHVYGFEDGALIMELVEGEDLAERIRRGPLTLDEALPIARQIAEALETAHEQDMVHRDLKPANIKVRPDGTVKVLDFGLAKALDPSGAAARADGTDAEALNSPTIASPAMTMHGMILGTAAYMSPEQAKGRPVDTRADIWAFGCVLFEMITGTRAFPGNDVGETFVAILRDDPDWHALPSTTPPNIRRLIRRCLQRDVRKRLPHIGVARLEIADAGELESDPSRPVPSRSRRIVERLIWALSGAAVVAIAAFALRSALDSPLPSRAVRFAIDPPEGTAFVGGNGVPRFAVSPDGRNVVYQVSAPGKPSHLWLRRIDTLESRPITATESDPIGSGAQQPFWSPDGRTLGFFDASTLTLNKLDLQSGLVQGVTAITGTQHGGSWNSDGTVLYASTGTNGVQRVSAAGGPITQVTSLDSSRQERVHLWPMFLPDGRRFLFFSVSRDTPPAVYVASLDGGPPKRVVESPAMAHFAPPNTLVYVRDQDSLVAQPFDLDRLELVGEPVLITNAILSTTSGRTAVSTSQSGVLVYATGPGSADAFEATWMDRTGQELSPPRPRVPTSAPDIRLSPDGKFLAFNRASGAGQGSRLNELWLLDTARQVETRVSTEPLGASAQAVFSPDASHVLHNRREKDSSFVLLNQPTSGVLPGEPLLRTPPGPSLVPLDWSSDGRWVVYAESGGTQDGLWVLPLAGDRKARRYLSGNGFTFGATLSPDGRWLAYTSGADRRRQVFVQPFPDPSGGKWPVSAPGGRNPRWRRDGREIFFIDGNDRLSAAAVALTSPLQIGTASPLFHIPTQLGYPYDVAPDGQSFIVVGLKSISDRTQLVVALDWMAPQANR